MQKKENRVYEFTTAVLCVIKISSPYSVIVACVVGGWAASPGPS